MTQRKIKIYSDRAYLPPNTPHTIVLYPFWGMNPEELEGYAISYERYAQTGADFFEMVGLDEAEYVVAAVSWQKNEAGRDLTRQLAQFATPEKPIWIFYLHDSTDPLPIDNSMVFRTSLNASQRGANEYALPAWRYDWLHHFNDGQLTTRPKTDKPVVGFCGFVLTDWHRRISEIKDIGRVIKYSLSDNQKATSFGAWVKNIGRSIKNGILQTRKIRTMRSPHHAFRWSILKRLMRAKRIETNFIIRHQFFGNAPLAKKPQYNLEYYENIRDSDYVVCVRGDGNFSYRLYEALCCGRIPVFINTDCVLPYDFAVDWKRYCVWIEAEEVDQIEAKILDFHQRLSPDEFVQLQQACRTFWEEYLSPHGYFKQLYRHFTQID